MFFEDVVLWAASSPIGYRSWCRPVRITDACGTCVGLWVCEVAHLLGPSFTTFNIAKIRDVLNLLVIPKRANVSALLAILRSIAIGSWAFQMMLNK